MITIYFHKQGAHNNWLVCSCPHVGSLGDKVLHKGGNRATSLPLLLLLPLLLSEEGVNVLWPKGHSQGAGEGVPQASQVTRQSCAVGGVGQLGHWKKEGVCQLVPTGSGCGLTEGQGSLSLWVAAAAVGLPESVETLQPAGRAHHHTLTHCTGGVALLVPGGVAQFGGGVATHLATFGRAMTVLWRSSCSGSGGGAGGGVTTRRLGYQV